MVFAVYVWNLTDVAPAFAAALTISLARVKDPRWFAETSAMKLTFSHEASI